MGKKTATTISKARAAERVKKIWPILNKTYPEARIALKFGSPLELLIATILSAQCTDTRVNMVTKNVFRKYRSARQWAESELKQIEADIRPTGFYHNKALSIKGACKMIIEKFDGKVPGIMEELLELPGVGRKTANVILGNAFGVPGVVCDTHVIRLSRRLQLSRNGDPVKLELDLMEIVPKKNWLFFSDLLIWHGRNICKARRPQCDACPIAKHCPAANKPDLW